MEPLADPVDENSALAWHPKDAEIRAFKKSKPSVQDFLKEAGLDAETPEENPISSDDSMNMKANNCQPGFINKEEKAEAFSKFFRFLSSFEVPISIEDPSSSEESDDEFEHYVAPPPSPGRRELILDYVLPRNESRSRQQEEAERIMRPVGASDEVKKAAKDLLERLQSRGVFGDLKTVQ